jgi:hypothetical protein
VKRSARCLIGRPRDQSLSAAGTQGPHAFRGVTFQLAEKLIKPIRNREAGHGVGQ